MKITLDPKQLEAIKAMLDKVANVAEKIATVEDLDSIWPLGSNKEQKDKTYDMLLLSNGIKYGVK